MQENTNKAIAINTIVLYIKLGINTICGLLTTRFALQALGVDDFGLFSVVGSVITFISMLNVIMLSTSNRYIATAIGKRDISLINKTFNVNLSIHAIIALVTLLIAYPLGDWYIYNNINFNGDIHLAINVFHVTVIGSVFSFVGVPFNGLLFAHEKFIFASIVDVCSSILKMIGAYSLLFWFDDKLTTYAILLSFLSAYPTIAYAIYSYKKYSNETRIRVVREWIMYRDVLGFSVWVGYGAIAFVGKAQGAALIINKFFNTALNTALGVANSINSMIQTVSATITKSISPQITKSYACGNYQRCEQLVIAASKINFMLLLLVSSPFLYCSDFIFGLWLGKMPVYADIFLKLLIFDAMIGALNAGIPDLIFASGRIKNYQVVVNTLYLFSIVVAYYCLKFGAPAYFLQLTYVVFSIIIFIVRQVVVNRIVKFDNLRIIKDSYVPSILVFTIFMVWLFVPLSKDPLITIVINTIVLIIIEYFIGLNRSEKRMINSYIVRYINR